MFDGNVAMDEKKDMQQPPPYSETVTSPFSYSGIPAFIYYKGEPYAWQPAFGGGHIPPYLPASANITLPTPTEPPFICAHCHGQFVYNNGLDLPQGPTYGRLKSVGSHKRCQAATFILCGLLTLLLGLAVIVSTFFGYHCLEYFWIGVIIAGICLIHRGAKILSVIKQKESVPIDVESAEPN